MSSIQHAGRELVLASLNGGPVETFTTTYRFESSGTRTRLTQFGVTVPDPLPAS